MFQHINRDLQVKPFNVVMTPSDKKRMMDSKNNSRVNVPELKPEQHNVQSTKEDSSEHQFSSENNLNESETNQQTSHEYQTQSESNDDGITGVLQVTRTIIIFNSIPKHIS